MYLGRLPQHSFVPSTSCASTWRATAIHLVRELADASGITFAAVRKHLLRLAEEGLVELPERTAWGHQAGSAKALTTPPHMLRGGAARHRPYGSVRVPLCWCWFCTTRDHCAAWPVSAAKQAAVVTSRQFYIPRPPVGAREIRRAPGSRVRAEHRLGSG